MCGECDELDRRIERYRRLSNFITDEVTLSAIAVLIERHEARKRELHLEEHTSEECGPHQAGR
jgi:hypothetical protein